MQQFATNKDGYLTFNGLTMSQLINESLEESGVFTDHNYQGSNITAINQTLSYVFSVMMMHLNQTSTETMFTESQLYENMSRLVKEIGYSPIGFQTSTLTFSASAGGIDAGLYTIPRYSSITIGGLAYSFNEDITFAKLVDSVVESLDDMSREKLLYQGKFVEHPTKIASGTDNELMYLAVDSTQPIDHFNVHVYVKQGDGIWRQWTSTQSLYLQTANDLQYELRLNENRRYELQFGNNINGRKLNEGDEVAVYYLRSDGSEGAVGAGVLSQQKVIAFDSTRFADISSDFESSQFQRLTTAELKTSMSFTNSRASTYAAEGDDVANIRENAPGVYRSQFRLVTAGDYVSFIKTNFANIVQDATVVNNSTYVNEYLKYFYDMGLMDPHKTSRALFNQVDYADACNFNNMYAFIVPKSLTQFNSRISQISPALRELVINTVREEKIATSETIIMDPVYVSCDIAVPAGNTAKVSDVGESELVVVEESNSRRDQQSIRNDIKSIIEDYFSRQNTKLGQLINVNQMTSDFLAVDGVKSVYSRNKSNGVTVEGLSLLAWNQAYSDNDIQHVTKNIRLPFFKATFWHSPDALLSKIVMESSTRSGEQVEN